VDHPVSPGAVIVKVATLAALVATLAIAQNHESLMVVVGAIVVIAGGRAIQGAVAAKREKAPTEPE
jgi:hypothetical protein